MNLHELKYEAIQKAIDEHCAEIKRLNSVLPEDSFKFTIEEGHPKWERFKAAFVNEFSTYVSQMPPNTFTSVDIYYSPDLSHYTELKFWFMHGRNHAEQKITLLTSEVARILQGY